MAKRKRFETDIPTPLTPEQVNVVVNQFAQVEGFTFTKHKGEDVLKKGVGMVSAPQFIKVVIHPGMVHIEAWLKTALLPGVYVGEMDLEGGYGGLIKQALKTRVDKLIAALLPQQAPAPQPVPPDAGQSGQAWVQQPPQSYVQQPIAASVQQPAPASVAPPVQATVETPPPSNIQPPLP